MSEELIPELGDFITLVSTKYGTTTGRIVYRDDTLLRIKPVHEQIVYGFPIGEDGLFPPDLGVTALLIKEKREDPHFSIQLRVVVGDELELFDTNGQSMGTTGKVGEVIANETMDALRFENGKFLNFQFVGPKLAIGFLTVKASAEPPAPEELETEEQPEVPDFEFNPDVVPIQDVEEGQFTYSDTTQRQDMFAAFMEDIPVKRQSDPKVSANLYRMTDLFLALKNSVVVRDSAGTVRVGAEPRSYIVNTVQDSLEKQTTTTLASVLPIANVKKVLYVDNFDPVAADEHEDVAFRSDIEGLFRGFDLAHNFEISTKKEAGFVPYMYSLFQTLRVLEGKQETDNYVDADQDVLRSKLPTERMSGFPVLPPLESKKDINLISNEFVGSIDPTYVRALGPSRTKYSQIVDRKLVERSFVVAQADTADIVSRVILSHDLMQFRSPIRSSMLLWDIVASERSRRRTKLFFQTLQESWDSQQVLSPDAPTSLHDVLLNRLEPSLALLHPHSTQVLDSFGLRNLELSQEVFQLLLDATKTGQDAWDEAYPKLAERAEQALAKPSVPVFSNIAALDSPLFPRTEQNFQGLLASYQEVCKYSSLRESDLQLAEHIWQTEGTAGFLWYAFASGLSLDHFPYVVSNFFGEMGRAKYLTQQKRQRASWFVAKPDINPCVHVKKYQTVQRIRNDEARMQAFQRFLAKYNGGRMDHSMRCNVCKRDLCCMHEVLLLNEFNHIGKQDVLHKALLLEFAGPAFEGSYICRVCGQKIRDIEYDTSIEFDDDGKPLVGRTVVTGEEEEPMLDLDLKVETEEGKEDFPFQGEDLILYQNLTACFEACGMEVSFRTDRERFGRTVEALRTFRSYLPEEEKYEPGRKKQLDTLKGEKKRKEFERQFPPYAQYIANAMVGCIGALAVLEFQTSAISVPNPVVGCTFSLSGVPIDEAGTEAIDYVVCAIVTRKPGGAVFSGPSWSLETNVKRMSEDVKAFVVFALDLIMQKKKATALAGVSEVYKSRLIEKQRSEREDLPSQSDRLPPSFRPMAQLPTSLPSEPVKNVAVFQSSLTREPFDSIAPIVARRQFQLDDAVLQSMHDQAKKDVIKNTNNPRSDGTGSFQRLAVVALQGRGYKSLGMEEPAMRETGLLRGARDFLRRRDPVASANGTHMYVPWSAPVSVQPVPEIDTGILYTLFLKHCFRGSYEGYVHELGPDYVCRRCGFAYPVELLYLTSSEVAEKNPGKLAGAMVALAKQREQILLTRFHEQGVTITEETFLALEEKVRMRKILPKAVRSEEEDLFATMDNLDHLFSSSSLEEWGQLKATLHHMHEERVENALDRKVQLGEFATHYDTRLEEIQAQWTRTLTQSGIRAHEATGRVQDAIVGFSRGTENPNSVCRNLTDMFVVGAGQIAKSKPNLHSHAKKWLPSINPNHLRELEDIWAGAASVVVETIQSVEESEHDTRIACIAKFDEVRGIFGGFLKLWSKRKPNSDLLDEEYTLVVRWITVVLLDGLIPTGPVGIVLTKWVVATLKRMLTITQTYQLSNEQIQLVIAEREEKERDYFIRKFDVLEGDMRQLELMKKKIGLGDWNVSAKNLFTYNSEWWDHERDQRAAMGLVPEFSGVGQAEEGGAGIPVNPYSDVNDHRVAEHEDE